MLLAVMAISSFAKDFNSAEWGAISKTDNSACVAYWESVTYRPILVLLYLAIYTTKRDKLDSAGMQALVDTLAVQYKITNADHILQCKVQILRNTLLDYQGALDLCLTGTGSHTKRYLGNCYRSLKRYDEAVQAFKDAGKLYYASYYAYVYNVGTKAEQFALASQALLGNRLYATLANKIFNILTDIDLDEAEVSEADYKKLLKKLKRKYSKTVKTTVDGVTKREYVYEDMRATIIDLLKDL